MLRRVRDMMWHWKWNLGDKKITTPTDFFFSWREGSICCDPLIDGIPHHFSCYTSTVRQKQLEGKGGTRFWLSSYACCTDTPTETKRHLELKRIALSTNYTRKLTHLERSEIVRTCRRRPRAKQLFNTLLRRQPSKNLRSLLKFMEHDLFSDLYCCIWPACRWEFTAACCGCGFRDSAKDVPEQTRPPFKQWLGLSAETKKKLGLGLNMYTSYKQPLSFAPSC